MVAATDPHQKSATSPAGDFAAITPSDTVDMPVCRAIYVGTGGRADIVNLRGDVVPFKNLASGSTLMVKARRVQAAALTAADLVALY
ncbi:MAG: hypothetical protein JWP35_4669 [Caulobacter sp.]|nr:hypothetical protein [Caulobacter sp.]